MSLGGQCRGKHLRRERNRWKVDPEGSRVHGFDFVRVRVWRGRSGIHVTTPKEDTNRQICCLAAQLARPGEMAEDAGPAFTGHLAKDF